MRPTRDKIQAAFPDTSISTDGSLIVNEGVVIGPITNADDWFNQLLDWKLNSPREMRKRRLTGITRGVHMQRQFTIELRVDYEDKDKHEPMRLAVQHAMRHMLATASLIADSGVKPQIAAYSDDWFSGNEEIKLFDDVIQQGLDETSATGQEDTVDPELLKAMAELK